MRPQKDRSNNKIEVGGFGSRLQTLMDFAGLKKYGRKRLIARWSGLSDSTATYLFKNDKGPRSDKAILLIADGLADAIESCRDIRIAKCDLIDYLMNSITFAELQIWTSRGEVNDYERYAHLLMCIHEAINENNLILKRDSIHSIELISEIIKKVDKLVYSNEELTYKSHTVYAYVKDLIKKSSSTLLKSV